MKTHRYVSLFLFAVIALFTVTVFGQDGTGEGETPAAPAAWSNLQLLIPLLATVLVFLIKKVPGWFETKFSKQLLPYICIVVAIVLTVLLDLMGKVSFPVWVTGPLAGAIAIGARELTDKGLGLLGLGGSATPSSSKPAGT